MAKAKQVKVRLSTIEAEKFREALTAMTLCYKAVIDSREGVPAFGVGWDIVFPKNADDISSPIYLIYTPPAEE